MLFQTIVNSLGNCFQKYYFKFYNNNWFNTNLNEYNYADWLKFLWIYRVSKAINYGSIVPLICQITVGNRKSRKNLKIALLNNAQQHNSSCAMVILHRSFSGKYYKKSGQRKVCKKVKWHILNIIELHYLR